MRQVSHKLHSGFTRHMRGGFTPLKRKLHPPFGEINNTWRVWGLKTHPRFLTGFTLIELAVTTLTSLILVLAVGIVVVSGQKAWQWTYNSANKKIKQDAETIMITFGNVGRKSNLPKCAFDYSSTDVSKREYPVYNVNSSNFTPVVPAGSNAVVFGNAVEFRYWDVALDTTDSHKLMDNAKKATAYALFYFDDYNPYNKDYKLKVDYGPYSALHGAVPLGGGTRNTPDRTEVLAEHVTPDIQGAFSYTTSGGVVGGSIRINVTITDPVDKESIKVMTSTLMRTEWPPAH